MRLLQRCRGSTSAHDSGSDRTRAYGSVHSIFGVDWEMSDPFNDDEDRTGFMFTVVVIAALFLMIIFSLANNR
jgi:hypothetical protein